MRKLIYVGAESKNLFTVEDYGDEFVGKVFFGGHAKLHGRLKMAVGSSIQAHIPNHSKRIWRDLKRRGYIREIVRECKQEKKLFSKFAYKFYWGAEINTDWDSYLYNKCDIDPGSDDRHNHINQVVSESLKEMGLFKDKFDVFREVRFDNRTGYLLSPNQLWDFFVEEAEGEDDWYQKVCVYQADEIWTAPEEKVLIEIKTVDGGKSKRIRPIGGKYGHRSQDHRAKSQLKVGSYFVDRNFEKTDMRLIKAIVLYSETRLHLEVTEYEYNPNNPRRPIKISFKQRGLDDQLYAF